MAGSVEADVCGAYQGKRVTMPGSTIHAGERENWYDAFEGIVEAFRASADIPPRVALLGSRDDMLDDFVSRLQGKFGGRFSRAYLLYKVVHNACLLLKSTPDPPRRLVEEAVDNLEAELAGHRESWTVVIPIENLRLAVQELTMGGVTFKPHVQGGTLMTVLADDYERLKADLQLVDAYAEVHEAGDLANAVEKGLERARMALYALCLWCSPARRASAPERAPTPPVVVGETSWRRRCIYAVPEGAEPALGGVSSHAGSFGWARYPEPLLLDEGLISSWRRLGFDRLSRILGRRRQGEMEQRIVRAVRWMGEARHTGNLEDAFVKNSIAMEALLLSPGGRLDDPKAAIGSITSQLAERAGFLLGRERDERATIVRKIRRLYGVRSGIVHGSQKVEHDDLTRWEIYVVQCLEAVLILEFRRIEDLVEWVDHVKYSGEPKSGRPLWHLLYGECDGERPAIWEGGGAIS